MNIFKSYVGSEETDYSKYRGKCKQFVDEPVAKDTSLRAVRGYYHCPIWGKQAHWWAEDKDGKIIDPTVKQFPQKVLLLNTKNLMVTSNVQSVVE